MHAVVLVDGAPGFESSIGDQLQKIPEVIGVAEDKEGNYDIAVLVEVEDEGELQTMLNNQLWLISGVRDLEVVKDPTPELMALLTGPAAT